MSSGEPAADSATGKGNEETIEWSFDDDPAEDEPTKDARTARPKKRKARYRCMHAASHRPKPSQASDCCSNVHLLALCHGRPLHLTQYSHPTTGDQLLLLCKGANASSVQ